MIVSLGRTDIGRDLTHGRPRYSVPLLTVGTPLRPLQPQRCTLPASFARVMAVDFNIAGALATAQFLAVEKLSYVLHNYC